VRGPATAHLTRASWHAGWRFVVVRLSMLGGRREQDGGRRYRPQRAAPAAWRAAGARPWHQSARFRNGPSGSAVLCHL